MALLAQVNGLPRPRVTAGVLADHPTGSLFTSTPAVLLLGLCLGLAQAWPAILSVWGTGAFVDTDDAMHLVQVRDWLAGQAWFDLTAHRLDPPQGVAMHWTRVLDVPMALLIKFFELLASRDTAERLMRLVYPMLLQVLFFAGIISVARKLVGVRGIAAAVVLAAFCLAIPAEFPPGRVNHHSAQITLLVFMLGATIDVLDPLRARRGALAGVLAALSLAISIENLPFIAMMIAICGVAWIVRGPSMARALGWFGAAFAGSALLAFVVTIPPERYANNVCDAFGGAHLIGAAAGGLAFLGLAAATTRLTTRVWRLGAAALAAGIVLAGIASIFPDCLKDPHSAVDPLVSAVWLANVKQARPLGLLLRLRTMATLAIAMPLLLGLVFAGIAAWRERGDARARWLVVAGFAGIGFIGPFWEVRVATSAAPLAIFGGVWLFVECLRWASRRARAMLLVPAVLMTMFIPIAWAVTLPDTDPEAAPTFGDPQACVAPSAFVALGALPPSRVFAPIDAGPFILAFTPHSVFAGPYHRNNHGNRLALDVMLGDPDKAHDRLRASGARYLAICLAADELSNYIDRSPTGFAALLRGGEVPSWLEPVPVEGTPYRVYEIR